MNIDHIAIYVNNLEVEKNFFAETGGLENLKRCLQRKQKIFQNM